jgi:F-type H+-transporting ATPase subunit beta
MGHRWVTHIAVQDIIAILGMDELSEEDKLTVARARKARPPRSPFSAVVKFGMLGDAWRMILI